MVVGTSDKNPKSLSAVLPDNYNVCGRKAGNLVEGGTYKVDCNEAEGRFVIVQYAADKETILELAEVKVFGEKTC